MPMMTDETVEDIISLVEKALADTWERMEGCSQQMPVYDDEDRRRFLEMSGRVGAALPILRDLPSLHITAIAQRPSARAQDMGATSVHPTG